MIHTIKTAARKILPVGLLKKSSDAYYQLRYRKALHAFNEAGEVPAFLPPSMISILFEKYTFESTYHYDPASIRQRGLERADALQALLSENKVDPGEILELGCGDGMVSGILQERGNSCTAVDFYSGGFDKRAQEEGVKFYQMDAADLEFKNNSFGFIFSYNAFEHFPKPDCVFEESLRVLKPGGYLYMEFSPLFMSPYGMHAYKSIPIPYCQHLFRESDMVQFIKEKNLEPVNFRDHVNRWSVERFRELWKKHGKEIKTVSYAEICNYNNLDLVWKYPSCFKSKTKNMDNLVVGGITALFQKKQPGA
jgi:ubiquinone/menaquinone biosynthesis C-methylase UbiE